MIKGIVIIFLIILAILVFTGIIMSTSHKLRTLIAWYCNIFVLLSILVLINIPEPGFYPVINKYIEIVLLLTQGLVGIFLSGALSCFLLNLLDKNEDIKE